MPITRKVLWIVSYDKNPASFHQHVEAAGIDTVCIRTTATQLPGAIAQFHAQHKTIWAWRWPGTKVATGYGPHYFAPEEAKYVAETLIPAGLDGYISDPESNDDQKPNDWNQKEVNGIKLSKLAKDLWSVIKAAAKGKTFHCGVTSGWDFPADTQKPILPWNEFITPVDAVYPQTYWRITGHHGVVQRFGGQPAVGCHKCVPIWQKVSQGKPIIPMAGEIDLVTPAEIAAYGAAITSMNLTEAHFYADIPEVKPEVLAAIKAL
jgi:hypothetical protein